MTDLNESVYRIVGYYNQQDFGIQAIYGKHIVSPGKDANQNTLACFITKIDFTGTPRRIVRCQGDERLTIIRFEPVLTIRTVFTGEQALMNSSLHYERLFKHLLAYEDMSLLANTSFSDASLFFEDRYLIRYQADNRYLVFLDLLREEPYITSIDEMLNAYLQRSFKDLLTQRNTHV